MSEGTVNVVETYLNIDRRGEIVTVTEIAVACGMSIEAVISCLDILERRLVIARQEAA